MVLPLCVVVAVVQSGPVSLEAVESLVRPYSGVARALPVAEVVAELSRTAGLKLEVSREVAELKVTYAVRNRKTGWLLDRLADVLDLQWVADGTGFRLEASAEATAALRQTRATFDREAQASLVRWKSDLVGFGQLPFEVDKERAEEISRAILKEQTDRTSGWTERIRKLQSEQALRYSFRSRADWAFGASYGKLSAQVERAFATGSAFVASYPPAPGLSVLPREAVPPEVTQAYLVAVGDAKSIGYAWISFKGDELSMETGRQVGDWEKLPEPADRFRKWSTPKAELETAFATPLEPTRLDANDPELTSADVLLDLAVRAGRDLVAEDFAVGNLAPLDGKRVVEEFGSGASAFGPFVRLADRVILYRHSFFWELRRREIPGAKLDALRTSVTARGLSMRDQAAFLYSLKPEQREHLSDVAPNAKLFDLVSFGDPVCEVWRLLPVPLAEALDRHEVVPLASAPAVAQTAIRDVLLRALLKRGDHLARPEILKALLTGNLARLSFLAERQTLYYGANRRGATTVAVPLEELPEGVKPTDAYRAVDLYLGTSAADSIRFYAAEPMKIGS